MARAKWGWGVGIVAVVGKDIENSESNIKSEIRVC